MALTPEETIAVLLATDEELVALRGDDEADKFFIGLDLVPQNTPLPFQVVTVTDSDPERHLGGRNPFVTTQMDIDHYTDTAGECMELARLTRNALEGSRMTVVDGNDVLDVEYLHWIDQTHVQMTGVPGDDHSVAHIRQQFEMMSASPVG